MGNNNVKLAGMQSCNKVGQLIAFYNELNIGVEFVKMGFHIGVGGVVTFSNSKRIKKVVQDIPIENIVLETDAPYLAPVPFRGKRNTSALLPYVVEAIAELKGMEAEDVIRITEENARRMYRITA